MTEPENLTVEERLDRIDAHLVRIDERHDTLDRRRRRSWIPYLILAIGMGVALWLVSTRASSDSLSHERTARLADDCRSRVEARGVLRDVISEAYTPPQAAGPDTAALIEARREALLRRVPQLRCEKAAGIPIPVPRTEPK